MNRVFLGNSNNNNRKEKQWLSTFICAVMVLVEISRDEQESENL